MDLILIQKIINSTNKYSNNFSIKNIKTNSKEIKLGDAFLCINSGYLYVDEAISNGASLIISEIQLNVNVPVLYVKNTVSALKTLGSYFRSQYKGKVIAITGSNGKTTTKEILSHLLSKHYKVLKNPDSENNLLGISNTLLKLDNNYDFLVLELGMNHRGEISELSNLIIPDIAIITNVGTSHIGLLGSKESIFEAKKEILDGNPNLELFVNADDNYLNKLNGRHITPKITYKDINSVSLSLSVAVIEFLNIEYCEFDLEDLILPSSRLTKYYFKKHIVIDDAYNASYESFLYGLNELDRFEEDKIVIFGDMLELGKYSEYYHRKVFEEIKKRNDIKVVTYGDITKILNNRLHFDNLDELKKFLISYEWKNEIIYLKASHKLNLSLLIPFFEHLW